MARRPIQALNKTYSDHFTPAEMEAIAAYCYARQPLPKYQTIGLHLISQAQRVWTPFERFQLAVGAFAKVMKDKKLDFEIADWDAINSVINSGDTRLTERQEQESLKIFKNLMSWDEASLKSYNKGTGGKMCDKLGFGEVGEATGFSAKEKGIAPFNMERSTLESFETLEDVGRTVRGIPIEATLHSDEVGKTEDISTKTVPEELPKAQRGRPRKTAVVG